MILYVIIGVKFYNFRRKMYNFILTFYKIFLARKNISIRKYFVLLENFKLISFKIKQPYK